jgi:transposase
VIVIGADSHKRSHTVVAVDQVGRRLGERTVKTTSDGHFALLEWSAQWPEATFALEDCRHLTGGWSRTCWPPGSGWSGCRPG